MASVTPGFGKARRRAHLLALEPRMMFDAAAGAVVQNEVLSGGEAVHGAAVADTHDTAPAHGFADTHIVVPDDRSAAARSVAPATASAAPHDVIFIDTSVDDYQKLAAEWAGKGEIVLIDGTKDGIDQMRAALAGDTNIAAIHIVSHGSEGVLYLGTTRIDEATIEGDLAASLGAIGRSLNPGGDILLYGCDFAEGSDGARALAAFAQATHADVAASTDPTGYVGKGGDWVLESRDGDVQAHALSSDDWQHTLDPNVPVPIAVTPDSLTVKDANGNVVATGSTGYVTTSGTDRTVDLGAGATARWAAAATLADGTKVDLVATVVSISNGDFVRFNRPTSATNGDDPTFLLRDASNGNGTNGDGANVQVLWQLVRSGTNTPIPANVEFGILDIDGVGGNPNTREAVSVPTDNLAYYTTERATDIAIAPSLSNVAASGTQNENTTAGRPLDTKSEVTFDWTKVSAFTINYSLAANNGVTTQAQFYQDGNADFKYTDPVYVSIPRLDLDANDSTANGNDAHFTFTTGTSGSPIVDSDVVVTNPMDIDGVTGATIVLTNAKAGDALNIGNLPSDITATVTNGSGTISVALSGAGSESDYDTALRAITFANASATPDTTQRVIDVAFSNAKLTSATAVGRIDINHAPVANPDSAATPEDHARTISVLANDTDADGDPLTATAASAQHGQVVVNTDGTLTYTPDADYNGSDTIAYSIADGRGGFANSTVAMTVIPQADPPVNHVPGMQSGTEDIAVTFSAANGNAVSVSDADGGSQTVTVAVAHGTLTLGGTGGLTFVSGDGTADPTMTFTGTVAAIDAALDGLKYTSAPDYNGADTLAITTTHVPVEGVDFQNGGAEKPVLPAASYEIVDQSQVPGWQTTATDHDIEVWSNGHNGFTAYEGNQFFEINANQAASLYQQFQSTVGSAIAVSFAHEGRLGTDVMQLTATDLGADGVLGTADDVVLFQQQYSDGNTAWGAYTAQITGAATGDAVRLDFTAISSAGGNTSAGNFLDAVAVQQSHVATTVGSTVAIALAPVADITPDSATTPEDTAVGIAALANDSFSDPTRAITAVDGQAIGAGGAAVSVANGQVALDGSNHLIFTPSADYNGTTHFTYTVTAGGSTETATETVTVTPVNDPPRDVGTLPARASQDAATISYATAGAFTDVDGDTLTYSATGLPSGLSIDPATGVISGTIDRSASQVGGGAYDVAVTATDPSHTAAVQHFALTVANPPPVAQDDGANVHVDTAEVIAVLANDRDPDGDPLTVTGATAQHATVAINADGTITYTPTAGYTGTDTIAYTISDGQGGTSSANVAVTVANAAPTNGAIGAQSASDGQAVSLPVAAYFTDPDGDALRYSATGLPTGLSIDPVTGTITGTIDRSASQVAGGVYDSVISVDDGHGGTDNATLHWTVANPAPIARDDSATTPEDTAVVIPVLANDSDPDGDPLTVTNAGAQHGTVAINPDGTITYTPGPDYNGTDTIAYTISDGQGGTATAHVAVMVTPVNDPPRNVGTLSGRASQDAATVSYATAGAFTDIDGDTLTYSATGLPAGLSIDPTSGIISGTIDRSASQVGGGAYDVAVTATDPSHASAVQHFALIDANPPPVARDDNTVVHVDTAKTIAVLVNDGDPDGDPLTVTAATAQHGTVAINPDGTITYTPTTGFTGSDTIAYTISDGQGGTSSANVVITVANAAPANGAIGAQSANDGQAVSLPLASYLTDADSDPLTYSATGLPAGLSIDPATGTVTGTIDRSASQIAGGVYDGVISVDDGHGGTDSTTLHWTIANPAPVAGDDSAITPEDVAIVIPVLANDVDPDGDPLTVTSATAQAGSVAINPDGTITYTPGPLYRGSDSIAYTITDGQGGTASAHVSVTVTPVNHAPTAQPIAAQSGADAQAVAFDVGGFFGDVDGDRPIYSATGLPPGLAIDPATGRIAGTLDHMASQGSVYHVVVTATDPSNAGVSSAFDWTIVNPAPVAANDSVSTPEDARVTIPVLANDRDPDGDALTVASASAQHGTVTINPDGTIDYVPGQYYRGNDVITYTIADGDGGRANTSVLVTVTPVNHAPTAIVAAPSTRSALEGNAVAIDAAPWFGDVDGDALTYTATGLPRGLSIDPVTGAISGVVDRSAAAQAPGADGLYAIAVTATDPSGESAVSRFTLQVANQAPVATESTARTNEDAGVILPALADVRDPDGDPLTVTAATADHGSVAINADGTIAYTPGPAFSGTDTVRYTVTDSDGATATAVVTVTVDHGNHPPIVPVQGQPIDAVGGRPVRIDALAGVTDADGDRPVVVQASSANGDVSVGPDGMLSFTPHLGFVGTATISYVVADGNGGFTSATFVVRVADGRGADIGQLLDIGRVKFVDPSPGFVRIVVTDGVVRNPLTILDTVDGIRSLDDTAIGPQPVGDVVAAIRTLNGIYVDGTHPVTGEVARLEALRDQRDAGDRLFDHRWSDFVVKGVTGFSVASDAGACIIIDSVVRGGAIYVEVRDTAGQGASPIRSVDIRPAKGAAPDWIRVDHRGLAIIERGADMDELHLVVRVTRANGHTSATPIVVQGATGEVELDRAVHARPIHHRAAPLNATLSTRHAAARADAHRIDQIFK